jgi:hypothetical protein
MDNGLPTIANFCYNASALARRLTPRSKILSTHFASMCAFLFIEARSMHFITPRQVISLVLGKLSSISHQESWEVLIITLICQMSFLDLVPDIQLLIVYALPGATLCILERVSRRCAQLAQQARQRLIDPQMLTQFPHPNKERGRGSLHAYYHYLMDTDALRRDSYALLHEMRVYIDQVEEDIQGTEDGMYDRIFHLYHARVPLHIDSSTRECVSRYELEIRYCYGTAVVQITDVDQGRVLPNTCRDRGGLYTPIPRKGFVPPAPIILPFADIRGWLYKRITQGYLPLPQPDKYLSEKIIRRHYNWFLDFKGVRVEHSL